MFDCNIPHVSDSLSGIIAVLHTILSNLKEFLDISWYHHQIVLRQIRDYIMITNDIGPARIGNNYIYSAFLLYIPVYNIQ